MIETPRLILRPLRAEDVELLFALDNDPEVMRWLNGGLPVSRATLIDSVLPTMLRAAERPPYLGVWVIQDRSNLKDIGWVSIFPGDIPGAAPTFGLRLKQHVWKQGFGVEAGSAILGAAFQSEGVTLIAATTYEANRGSRALLGRLGFVEIERFRYTTSEVSSPGTFVSGTGELWPGEDIRFELTDEAWHQRRG